MRSAAGEPRCPFTDPARIFDDLQTARRTPGLLYSEALGRHVVSRYGDLIQALHDPEVFSSQPVVPVLPSPWGERFEGRVPDRGSLIGHDNPTHDRLRAAINTFFVPRRLASFEPWIEQTAHDLMDAFSDEGRVEFKSAFALPMPLRAIAHIVGLDDSRAEWLGFALSFFMGPRDTHYAATPEEKAGALLELHEYVRQVMEERRVHRADDLISHVWNVRDSGEVEMTDWEMLSLFPGLMLAGHETTSNLICMALAHLLGRPGAYEHAQADDGSRARALEELLRFESAITGMPRVVTRDTVLGGTALTAGDEVFLAYASGSRDETRFSHADELDPDRIFDTPHLGFGQGIHACIGAPLARMLLTVELRVIHERLPRLRLAEPYEARTYGVVSEGRGMPALELEWDAEAAQERRRTRVGTGIPRSASAPSTVQLEVSRIAPVADDVLELTLRSTAGPLPAWEPGAHVSLSLASGLERSYSLTGHPSAGHEWKVAVLAEPNGRGGSAYVHTALKAGDPVSAGAPRNHFRFTPSGPIVFLAGGIGITPLIPMICAAAEASSDWRLVYLGRSRGGMAYLEMLERFGADRVTAWPADERGRYDLGALFAGLPQDTAVYCCGPERLLSAAEQAGDEHGILVETERFAPRPRHGDVSVPFVVELARSGREIVVPAEESTLDALNRAGCAIMSTCREGTCGTCEVRVLVGEIDHRDSVLTRDEQAANHFMMTCVSRASDRITLDL